MGDSGFRIQDSILTKCAYFATCIFLIEQSAIKSRAILSPESQLTLTTTFALGCPNVPIPFSSIRHWKLYLPGVKGAVTVAMNV